MRFPRACLQVFARSPEPGQTKTRLIPLLGADGAAAFHGRLVHTTLEKLVSAELCPVELWCSPVSTTPFFRDCRKRYGIALNDQATGDLGWRMHHALNAALHHSAAAVLVGTDCPSLSVDDIGETLAALNEGADVVFGPAHDGGYYLVGLQRTLPEMFSGISWGTAEVLAASLERLGQLGLSHYCLTKRMDIDTPDDYRLFMSLQTAF